MNHDLILFKLSIKNYITVQYKGPIPFIRNDMRTVYMGKITLVTIMN